MSANCCLCTEPVNQADVSKKGVPVIRRSQPHAGNDVADRYAHRGLLLMFGAYDFVRGGTLRGKPFVEPDRMGPTLGRDREGVAPIALRSRGRAAFSRIAAVPSRAPLAADRPVPSRLFASMSASSEHPGRARFVPQATQILHEHNTQRNGDRPQLTNRERLHSLIRGDKAAQNVGIECGCRYAPRMPKPRRKHAEIPAGGRLKAWELPVKPYG